MAEPHDAGRQVDYPPPTLDEEEIEPELRAYIKYQAQQIARQEIQRALSALPQHNVSSPVPEPAQPKQEDIVIKMLRSIVKWFVDLNNEAVENAKKRYNKQ